LAAGVTGPLAATTVSTPLGELIVVVSPHGVLATAFDDDGPDVELRGLEETIGAPVGRGGELAAVRGEVDCYFRGSLRSFSTPVDLSLVPPGFGRRVLEETARIPFGELVTYGDVAAAAGVPRGGRAAGNALNRCPIELFVPCHRVVHASGAVRGYGRHEDRKRWLLRHEGAI
jgi:methylated-DNA-[protein]-cysteine S-methyltransferase